MSFHDRCAPPFTIPCSRPLPGSTVYVTLPRTARFGPDDGSKNFESASDPSPSFVDGPVSPKIAYARLSPCRTSTRSPRREPVAFINDGGNTMNGTLSAFKLLPPRHCIDVCDW